MGNATIITLGGGNPQTNVTKVATFEEAFGEFSELRGRGRQRKADRRADRTQKRTERRTGRISSRDEVKRQRRESKIARRQDRKAQRQEGKTSRMGMRQDRRMQRKEGNIARRELGREEEELSQDSYQDQGGPQDGYQDKGDAQDSYQNDSQSGGQDDSQSASQNDSQGDSQGDSQNGGYQEQGGSQGSSQSDSQSDSQSGGYQDNYQDSGSQEDGGGYDDGYSEDEGGYNDGYSEDEGDYNDGYSEDSGFDGEFVSGVDGAIEIEPKVKTLAQKIEWNKELISRLKLQRRKEIKAKNEQKIKGINARINARLKRIAELEEGLSNFVSDETSSMDGEDFNEIRGIRNRQVSKAKRMARNERMQIYRGKSEANRSNMLRNRVIRGAETPVEADLNPDIESNRIVIPSEERSNARGTGMNALDLENDYDAPRARYVELSSNVEGDPKKKFPWIAVGIGVVVAGVVIYALYKSKALKK
jgi:hypothetical protein